MNWLLCSLRHPALATSLAVAGLTMGCATASLETDPEFSPPVRSDTRIARAVDPLTSAHPGDSGYSLLPDGMDSFLVRIAAIEAAEVSIEAQYYIFKNDVTGRLFLDRLLAAADRGVKVRLLVDDLAKTWKDRYLAYAVAHPNFDMRLFNPAVRVGSVRAMHSLSNLVRIHRRMHNKELVVDGKLAIIGGRNIGDEYFEAGERNVTDLDALVIGEIVPSLVQFFDDYWNYSLSVPVEQVASRKRVTEELRDDFRAQLAEWNESEETKAYIERLSRSEMLPHLREDSLPFYWGPAQAFADDPTKLDDSRHDDETHLSQHLAPYVRDAESSIILISPYFIPGKEGSEALGAIVDKGVGVVVVTNSLDSNDHPLVHSAYMKYRKRLLKAGVQLLETKAAAGGEESNARLRDFSAGSLLHTKLFIIDERYVMIGSTNLDPRSDILNTELMTVFDSPQLAADIFAAWELGAEGKLWKLSLDEDEKITWNENRETAAESRVIEPGTTWWDRQKLRLLALIPIEEQL